MLRNRLFLHGVSVILASNSQKSMSSTSFDLRGLKSAISGITDIFHKVENLRRDYERQDNGIREAVKNSN